MWAESILNMSNSLSLSAFLIYSESEVLECVDPLYNSNQK